MQIGIKARIEDIRYQAFVTSKIKTVGIDNLDINEMPSSCIVRDDNNEIAISKWVSPKRTRSYPYARVYDTIFKGKRATIIPVVKDEGIDGDRDFLQWDTICLMSLLQVCVILAYYDYASKNVNFSNKITSQKFNNAFVKAAVKNLLSSYQSDSLHWNIRQLKDSLPIVISEQIEAYNNISNSTGVEFHSSSSLINFRDVIEKDLNEFMATSRLRAEQAQLRELGTIHKYENLEGNSKSSITITNIVGGTYYFTVDEVLIHEECNSISLIEGKHTSSSILPTKADIKDGLLKMILYTNLRDIEVELNGRRIINLSPEPILKLTSPYILKSIDSSSTDELEEWYNIHNIRTKSTRTFIKELFHEASFNNFAIQIKQALVT